MRFSISTFPIQRKADSEKGEDWKKECVDAACFILDYQNDYVRKSIENKQINYDLRNGKANFNDLKSYVDVHDIGLTELPENFKHIGRGNSFINLLIGEEISRGLNIKTFISSSDKNSISQKEQKLKELILNNVNESLQSQEINEQDLKKFENYLKYDWQDLKEITASKLLTSEIQKGKIKNVFTECFEDALIAAEEIVCSELHGDQPILRKVNPLNLYTLGSGTSNKVEDSDIIVEYQFLSIGQIIDRYYDHLTEAEVKDLEEIQRMNSSLVSGNEPIMPFYQEKNNVLILSPEANNLFNRFSNKEGNVRVATVNWRSKRKIGRLKFYDPITGNESSRLVHENYKPDKELGEEIKWLWINEWWEGTKIGKDIYVNIKPIPFKGSLISNLSKSLPNYIGQYYNTNEGESKSLYDMIKPLDYSYDILYWKRDQEIALGIPNILQLNEGLVPDGWDPDMYLDYVTRKRVMWINPYREILKGPSQGKSAGFMNTFNNQIIQNKNGDTIKLYSDFMLSLEEQMARITGITPQREAQVHQSETVGGIKSSLNQSSHITERWFNLHDDFKERALTKHFETIKYTYKKNPKLAQYIVDEVGLEIISNYDEVLESEFDFHIGSSRKEAMIQEFLQQHALEAFQNQQATIGDMVSILKSDSTQNISRKLEESRERIQQQLQEAQYNQNEFEASIKEKEEAFEKFKLEQEASIERAKLLMKKYEIDSKRDDKNNDTNMNWLNDEVEAEMQRNKLLHESKEAEKERKHKSSEAEKERRSKEKIAKMKPKPTTTKK